MDAQIKNCQSCKAPFRIDPEDFDFYKKMGVPPPTWCPQCRLQRRLAFMNDRDLYKRTCDLCGKNMIAMYPADSKFKVYCNPCWWSDKWDGSEYAKEYDPSRPFLEQLKALNEATPQMALELNYPTLVNSEYINHAATAKNCYLIFVADECENVLYSEILLSDKDSMDCTILGLSQLCYGCIDTSRSYKTFFSENCDGCQDVYFSKSCHGCTNCFGCVNLKNKNYYIFNEPHSKEDYQKKLQEFNLGSYKSIEEHNHKAREFWEKYPRRYGQLFRTLNVTGDYTYFSKNAKDMYLAQGMENCRYCSLITMPTTKDSYDYTIWGNGAQRMYEVMVGGEGADNIKFSFQAWPNVHDIEYSMLVLSSSYMFGCANIRNKEYCILNKQYSKEEFEILRAKIIRDMNERPYRDTLGRTYPYGEFFPPEFSAFGYNESYGNTLFPLKQGEAKQKGFLWYEAQPVEYATTLKAMDIPDAITDIRNSIFKEIIECASCKKSFRIIQAELDLLRNFGLPVPRQCPNCRFRDRWSRINPPQIYHRACQCAGKASEKGNYKNVAIHSHKEGKCPNEFETSYAPDRSEFVYCEQCYQDELT